MLCGALIGCGRSAEAPQPARTETDAGAAVAARPNVLLITVDTLRADHLGSYGRSEAQTPVMDALAREGARFTSTFTHVPMTLPAHASMMTGRLPFRHGVRNNGTYRLAAEETTLAEILDNDGYRTGAALGAFVLLRKFGLAQGFDQYDDQLQADSVLRVFDTEIAADQVVAKWRQWRRRSHDDSPFFYWAHFYDPHLPYEPPEPFRSQFPDHPYDGEVAFVDSQIGLMIDDLRQDGLLDQTLVVLTSDHGESFGEHGETGHGLTAYRSTLQVPLILKGPGVPAGATVETRLGLVDLLPSLLELISTPMPPELDLDGKSFVPLLRGEVEDTPREVYFETLLGQEDRNWAPLTGLYSDDRKLISVPRPELYDPIHDPDEQRNLVTAERRTYRRLDERLRSLLLGTENNDGSRRELSAEDQAKLESLGYISSQGGGRGQVLDPKDGLELDRRLRRIEGQLTSDPEAASAAMMELKNDYSGYVFPSFFLFEHRIAVRQGRADAAVAALERGAEALPEVYPLRYELARYLIDQNRFEEAVAVAKTLVEQHEELSQGWILLGRAHEPSDLEASSAAYARGYALEPGNHKLGSRMADIRTQLGDLDGALRLHDELIDQGVYDQDPEGLFKAAMLHMRRGTIDSAETLFARALSLKPQGFYFMSYALVLERNGKRAEAAEALQNALAPDHVDDLTPEQAQLARSTLDRWLHSP